jgi:hypothetical protein
MTDTVERATPGAASLLPKAYVIPEFASEAEEAEFWANHDISELLDQMEDVTGSPPSELAVGSGRTGSRARKRPPNGRMDLVSIRLPAAMIDELKAIAERRHVPYQTMIRAWLGERLEQEERSGR